MAGARVSHFELQADDPSRAKAFYESVFGWEVKPVLFPGFEYWTISVGAGEPVTGGILRRVGPRPQPLQPVNAFTSIISVSDLTRVLADALSKGAMLAVPAFLVPTVGWRAFITDTEGNLVGLLQPLS
jgi:predicted enzyme related to lactoylglutathione lyase